MSSNNTLKKSIYPEQVKLLYSNMQVVISGNIIVITILFGVFWNVGNRMYMGLWILLMIAVLLARHFDTKQFFSIVKGGTFHAEYWEKRFIIGTAVSGVMWGILFLILMTPNSPEYVLFIICSYASLISGANATGSARVRVFLAYLFPASIPLTFSIMFAGSSLYFIMSIGFIIFMIANIVVSITFSRIIYNAIRLRFENLSLIDELKIEKERAEKAVLAKDKFLASASHDLRQPLHAQGLYLDAIEKNVKDDGKQQLHSIRKTNEALSNLFNSLLDVSRLNAGIVEVEKKHVYLKEILDPILDEFKGHAERTGLSLELACPEDLIVIVDHVLLKRVVRNLISNAFRYTKKGGIAIECCSDNDKTVTLFIVDSGVGIPENELENVFLEYHQLANPERDREKGLGLGLAIVKKLCALMDLPLECHSTLGKGSSFSMSLPKSKIKLIKNIQQESPQSVKGTHVLVIDDEKEILDGMIQLLNNWGCIVTVAESADEALDKLAHSENTKPIDLIIADYRLRENKTGAEAINKVHDFLKRDVSAVIITGDTSVKRLKEATRKGFYLLHKPVSPARLRTVLFKSLQKT